MDAFGYKRISDDTCYSLCATHAKFDHNKGRTCAENATCKNVTTVGRNAFSCVCKSGYTGDGYNCEDTNECDLFDHLCKNETCINTVGSYECLNTTYY